MFTCFACGNDITDEKQKKPFGRCEECLEAIAEAKAASIADYWQLPKVAKDWMFVRVFPYSAYEEK